MKSGKRKSRRKPRKKKSRKPKRKSRRKSRKKNKSKNNKDYSKMDKDYSKFDLPSEYWAKFRDISNIIDNNFNKQGYTDMDGSKEQSRRIKKYMKEHPEINTGDILFVGTDYDRD